MKTKVGDEYPETSSDPWAVQEDCPETRPRHAFDLEERTARFGEAIIPFLKKVPRGPDNNRLIDQLIFASIYRNTKP